MDGTKSHDLVLTPCNHSYLELADWELKDAIQSAKEDREWEQEDGDGEDHLKSGQIGVRVDFKGGQPRVNLTGTGHSPSRRSVKEKQKEQIKPKPKPVVHSKPPAIATKSVLAEDLYNVSQ